MRRTAEVTDEVLLTPQQVVVIGRILSRFVAPGRAITLTHTDIEPRRVRVECESSGQRWDIGPRGGRY